jgi:hypothetical protein
VNTFCYLFSFQIPFKLQCVRVTYSGASIFECGYKPAASIDGEAFAARPQQHPPRRIVAPHRLRMVISNTVAAAVLPLARLPVTQSLPISWYADKSFYVIRTPMIVSACDWRSASPECRARKCVCLRHSSKSAFRICRLTGAPSESDHNAGTNLDDPQNPLPCL